MKSFSDRIIYEGLTFDDVLLLPAASSVLPRDVELTTRFSRNIVLSAPIVSSAMDTVTDSTLAIAIAREGGLGVIHKNMTIEQQMEHVRKVKRSENGMIYDPIVIGPEACVGDALRLMADNHIGGIPVIDKKHRLIGIVTNRDLRFVENPGTPISEVMTKENLITIHDGADLGSATNLLKIYKIEKLPVVDKHFKLIGLLTFKDITKIKDNPKASKDSKGRLRTAAAVGVKADTLEKIEKLLSVDIDAVVIDTAHGHSAGVLETVRKARKAFPHLDIVAGNVATASGAIALAESGADAVKVGIGPGSICTTRVVAGVGVPQLSAIMQAYSVLKDKGIPIIADGGIRYSGDMVKALAAGADTVMAGSLFAGVEESPGETIILNGRKFKSYRGMGSLEAMQQGSKDRYFQDAEEDVRKLVPEGIVAQVPYKGTLGEVFYQLAGGLRAGMGYCGTPDLASLKMAEFVRITSAGVIENHPHDVTITREAPNYSR
ncbi:MAG: IMP dehydrogenase [Bacteroidales bacterium]|jgi:IMP dehydrogenase|nr:IMP dehydrogenase [Bacteroidales bacterium]MDD3100025.1 IMP dehydrogenase [Bacteroidales bacterium]MDD3638695.1 IMP dehydrogenase [Bacteroidales bacterium]MDD3943526.1 IMP dehydrogenase [Bacteroidales bacterium]MDD4480018.1 IMP dehydrogenase [Bacteroidales bacterium]